MLKKLKIGDKVTFDTDQIKRFETETDTGNEELKKYQKLVLAGVDQVGVVKEFGLNLTTVSYPDGWELPVPTKYLLYLPEID